MQTCFLNLIYDRLPLSMFGITFVNSASRLEICPKLNNKK